MYYVIIIFYRTNDSCDAATAVTKKYCTLQEFGTFRKEDFTCDEAWGRFVTACEGLRKEKLLLQRKNERLCNKIESLHDIVKELKTKNLVTNSVADMLNVS